MGKLLRVFGVILLGVILVAGVVVFSIYRATKHVPRFYEEALAADPSQQRIASEQLASRVTMLYSDTQQRGEWQALFTQQQINGWLAVDLVEKHGDVLPDEVRDPRVEIASDMLTLGFRIEDENVQAVISLGVEPFVEEPNTISLRFREMQAGSVPLPRGQVVKYVNRAALKLQLPVRWTQIENDPVAIVTIPQQRDEKDRLIRLERLEIHDGEVYLSGTTRRDSEAPPPEDVQPSSRVASEDVPRS